MDRASPPGSRTGVQTAMFEMSMPGISMSAAGTPVFAEM